MGDITMAQAFNTLDETQRSQMACTFAALLLHDDRVEVTCDSMRKVIDAAGVNVAPYWPMLFAQALNGKDLGSFLNVSSGSAPAQVAVAGGDAGNVAAKEEEKAAPEEEKKRRTWISVTCSVK